jgi:serine protease Do
MIRKTIVLTLAVFVFCANAALAEEVNVDSIDKACESTVVINGDKVNNSANPAGKDSSAISFNGVGAGVLVDPRGYIITNYHVIEGIRKIQVKTYDGQEHIGQIVSYDLSTDIAVIKIKPNKPLVPIAIGDSSKLRRMTGVVVTGLPFGYSHSTNSGEISGLYREVPVKDNLKYINMIQISASINPGNSGGPLLTKNGEMIGINSALRQDANSIAFALPADFVMEVGANLLNQYTSQYCYHGIRFKEIDVNLIGTPGINVNDYKVLAIASVDPGSPAEEVGLLPGDILLQANDLQLDRKLDLQRSLIDKQEGDNIHLEFDRNGTRYQADLVLRNPKSKGRQTAPSIAEYVWNTLGLRVTPVTKEEFQRRTAGVTYQFAFDGAVEVQDVKPGGMFASLKIQKGDMLAAVITPKDPWNITLVSDLKYLAERWTPEEMGGNEVRVVVVRNRELLEGRLTVTKNSLANSSQKVPVR